MISELLAFFGGAIFLGAQAAKETNARIEADAHRKRIDSIGMNMSRQMEVSHLCHSYNQADQEKICELVKNSKCTAVGKDIAIAALEKGMECVNYRRSKNRIARLSDYVTQPNIDLCVWVVAQDEGWIVDKLLAPNAPTGYDIAKDISLKSVARKF